jgi:hypothetical protein
LPNAVDAVLAFDGGDNGDDEGEKLESHGISVRHDSGAGMTRPPAIQSPRVQLLLMIVARVRKAF